MIYKVIFKEDKLNLLDKVIYLQQECVAKRSKWW